MTFFARRSNTGLDARKARERSLVFRNGKRDAHPRDTTRATGKRGHLLTHGWSRLAREVVLRVWNKRSACVELAVAGPVM